jgi:hypothetical protein
MEELLTDALSLLKAQEPIEPIMKQELAKSNDASTVGGWISVKDRLPPMYHMVLITGKNSAGGSFGVIKGSHDGDKGQWYRDDIGQYVDSRGDTVTHWMPLPELPKEEI